MKRAHLIVEGRVQGVCFRHYSSRKAQSLALTGWVRNQSDGTVEILAEGPAGAIDTFVTWCRHGPPSARVLGVHEQYGAATGSMSGFRIRY